MTSEEPPRRVRDRARTLLTVDETVAKIDATADVLGVRRALRREGQPPNV